MSKLTDGYRWQPNVNSCVCVISVAWQSRIFFTKRKFVYYDLVGASVMNSLGFGHFHHLVLFPHAMVDMAGLSEIHLTSFVLMVHWCMNNAFLLFLSLKSYAFNFTVNRTCLLFTLVSTFFFFFFFFWNLSWFVWVMTGWQQTLSGAISDESHAKPQLPVRFVFCFSRVWGKPWGRRQNLVKRNPFVALLSLSVANVS